MKFKGTYLRKRRSKLWTVKWKQPHNYQQLNLKNKNKNKLGKELEQEQNHKNGEYGHKIEEKVKAMQSETKKNI